MDKQKQGKFSLSKDGDIYRIGEAGFEVFSIREEDLSDIITLLLKAECKASDKREDIMSHLEYVQYLRGKA